MRHGEHQTLRTSTQPFARAKMPATVQTNRRAKSRSATMSPLRNANDCYSSDQMQNKKANTDKERTQTDATCEDIRCRKARVRMSKSQHSQSMEQRTCEARSASGATDTKKLNKAQAVEWPPFDRTGPNTKRSVRATQGHEATKHTREAAHTGAERCSEPILVRHKIKKSATCQRPAPWPDEVMDRERLRAKRSV